MPPKRKATQSEGAERAKRRQAVAIDGDGPSTDAKHDQDLAVEEHDQIHPHKEDAPLPASICDSDLLPTLSTLRPWQSGSNDLEYQSTEKSRTFTMSLERSRRNWIQGLYFDRYWTKPSSNKDINNPTPPNNPQKSWMREIGPCTIIVEPLIFDVAVYYSREPSLVSALSAQQADGTHRPPAQPPSQPVPQPIPPPKAVPKSSSPATQIPVKLPSKLQNVSSITTPIKLEKPADGKPISKSPIPTIPAVTTKIAPQPSTIAPPPHIQPVPQNNVVVQMLATRAASNKDLKQLMQIVATNKANKQQLQSFQRHIEDIHATIKANPVASPQTSAANTRPPTAATTPRTTSAPSTGTSTPTVPVPRPVKPAPPTTARKAAPPIPPWPIAIEFTGADSTTDRFLFPRQSILESLGPNSLLVSFLVLRKGVDARGDDRHVLSPEREYYEPVTIKVDVLDKHRSVLEYIRRFVEPPEKVAAYMREQILKCDRAAMRFLALNLPVTTQMVAESRPDTPATSTAKGKASSTGPPAVKKGSVSGPGGKEKATVGAGKRKDSEAAGQGVGSEAKPSPIADAAEVDAPGGRSERLRRRSTRVAETQ